MISNNATRHHWEEICMDGVPQNLINWFPVPADKKAWGPRRSEWEHLAPPFGRRILGLELDFGLGLELGLGSGLKFRTNDSLRTANIRRQKVPYP